MAQAARTMDGWLSDFPFYPWLLAAFPVIRLYAENLVDVEPGDVILPLVVVLLATTAGMAALSLLLHEPRRAAIIVSAVLVPALSFGLVLDVLPASRGVGRLALLAVCAIAVLLAVIVALRIRGRLGALTSALNLVAAVLLVLVLVPAASGVADAMRTGDGAALRVAMPVAASEARPSRDIYHLVLDRYGSERSLRTGFGIDNSAFIAWLREHGFQVLDDSHANYARTLLSLGSTLGMSMLDDIVAASGPTSRDMRPVVRRIKESPAGAFLQELGYEYIHIGSWFDRTGESKIADQVLRPVDAVTFGSTLRDLTILGALDGRGSAADEQAAHAAAARAQFAHLDELRDDPGPKYVFAHILLPHPPYVFLEDGTFAPGRATLESQLAFTNRSVRRFLEPLLAMPEDERPIIIVQADEGPYPLRLPEDADGLDWSVATADDLITKFGILDAWHLPGPEGEVPLREGMTAVNTYPELFRRYFGVDIADEPDRIYASTVQTPYDMTDVTEQIAAAERTSSP